MSDFQELIDGHLDGELTAEQEKRLADWLAADREHMRLLVREAHLHRQLRDIMLAQSFQIKASPVTAKMERPDALPLITAAVLTLRRIWLPLAACLILALGFGVWYLNPNVGQPVLAEVHGSGLILERAGQRLPATMGVHLQPGDVLKTRESATAVIGYAPEPTRVTLLPGTELTMTAIGRGKVFALDVGKLEATVARQSPFRPMVLNTAQAQARVVGTRFTLTVRTNSTRLDVMEGKVRFTRLSDEQFVNVTGGHYAVAANNYELAALPFTGSITREWWSGVAVSVINDLRDDPRFPGRPDGSELAKTLELEPIQTNHFVVRFVGFLHPPISGDYEFWLTGATQSQLLMSPDADPAQKVIIAVNHSLARKVWDQPRVNGGSNWAPPVPLVAGRIYYIEAIVLIEKGEGHLAVAWKPPGGTRTLLTGEFLSPLQPPK